MKCEIYQVRDKNNKIVFIPKLGKLLLFDVKERVPDFTEIEDSEINKPKNVAGSSVVHLIVNNKCNLKCIYCYADSKQYGDATKEMSYETAIASINKVIEKTKQRGLKKFDVGFIGGEPTLSLSLLENVVKYIKKSAEEQNLAYSLGIVTNGIFGEKVSDFLLNNFNYVTFSMDGFKELHNLHRPLVSGGDSFDIVFQNAKKIYKAGLPMGIRCTVSDKNVSSLPQIIEFFHNHFSGCKIGIEPVQEIGRCFSTNTNEPNDFVFVKSLLQALKKAKEIGVNIKNSVIRYSVRDEISFCGVNGKNFAVDMDGNVSACTRVMDCSDFSSKFFHYGRYDSKTKDFIFFDDKIRFLKNLTLNNISDCKKCFAKFNCKGGCSYMKAQQSQNFYKEKWSKCESIKELVLGLFKMQLEID